MSENLAVRGFVFILHRVFILGLVRSCSCSWCWLVLGYNRLLVLSCNLGLIMILVFTTGQVTKPRSLR